VAAGRLVALLDVPKCRNSQLINGLHLADWCVHGRYFPKPRSQPTGLAAEVMARFGPGPASRCGHAQPDDDIRDIVRNLRASAAMKRAAGLYYLASAPWDLFLLAFKEAHCASHVFWDFDPSHPAHDPGRRGRLGDPAVAILRDIDAAIGDLVGAAGPAAEVVVFSTSDSEPNGNLDPLMTGILAHLNTEGAAAGGWRCALLLYNENCAAARVTGAGEPPDPERLAAIEARLIGLRDADTGRPVVAAITRPSCAHAGSRAHLIPDLLVQCVSGAIRERSLHPGSATSRSRVRRCGRATTPRAAS
jgi:hypothetical protein